MRIGREDLRRIQGLRVDLREVLVTSALETQVKMREHGSDPTLWPLGAAIIVGIELVGVHLYTKSVLHS